MVDGTGDRADIGPVGHDGASSLSGLAARRRGLSRLLGVRPLLPPGGEAFALSCGEFQRGVDDYTAALTEAAPADFQAMSRFLTARPRDDPALPWLHLAAGDWTLGPAEARRRLLLLDQAINRQLLRGVSQYGLDHREIPH